MKKQLIASFAVLLLVPLFAIAQEPAMVVANINFAFHAGGQVMPAGTYDFRMDESGFAVILTNQKTDDSIVLPSIARLDQLNGDEASVEFEKVGDQYYISELNVPDMDGFQFAGVPMRQTHVSVKGVKK
jgi:hypothetical protein